MNFPLELYFCKWRGFCFFGGGEITLKERMQKQIEHTTTNINRAIQKHIRFLVEENLIVSFSLEQCLWHQPPIHFVWGWISELKINCYSEVTVVFWWKLSPHLSFRRTNGHAWCFQMWELQFGDGEGKSCVNVTEGILEELSLVLRLGFMS